MCAWTSCALSPSLAPSNCLFLKGAVTYLLDHTENGFTEKIR